MLMVLLVIAERILTFLIPRLEELPSVRCVDGHVGKFGADIAYLRRSTTACVTVFVSDCSRNLLGV